MSERRGEGKAGAAGKRVKICQMTVRGELAGAQRVALDICQALDPERWERHVVCREEGTFTERLKEEGIDYHLVAELVRPVRPHRDALAVAKLRRLCRDEGFDVVHTHSTKSGLLGRVAARLAGVPHILHHVHGFSFHEYSGRTQRLMHSQAEAFAARFCDRVIFVNDEERQMSVENGWVPAEKALTIYNGTDLERYDPGRNGVLREAFREEHGLAEDETAILVTGRISEQKQSLILPEIAAALEQLRAEGKWRLLVAGTGELEEALRETVGEKGMGERVKLLGWQPMPERAVAGADVMLLPSLWEGLPLVLIEAQAGGLPIVASDIKGNREVVTEETGFLCEPKEANDYGEALAKLCDDAGMRTAMGRAARKRAEETFDARRTYAAILEVYEELLRHASNTGNEREG